MVVKVVVKQAFSTRRALLLLVLMILVVLSLACADAVAQSPQIEPRPIGLELVAEGFTAPVQVVPAPDELGRLFVVDQAGQIWIIASDGILLQEPFLDIADGLVQLRRGLDERGLLSLAFTLTTLRMAGSSSTTAPRYGRTPPRTSTTRPASPSSGFRHRTRTGPTQARSASSLK
jgi:hypothetical protein